MDAPFDLTPEVKAIKAEMEKNGPAAAAEKAQEYLKEKNNIPLNIGITGESGSGKSTFVNAFRGVDDEDDKAAPTGVVETTMNVTSYPHPNYLNVKLWDLPGVGTTKFPADEYLKHVGFERFDFFIIISDSRFRENDVKLAQEIQKMGKKFYFVRSKIDQDLYNEKRKKNFNEENTLVQIRTNCIQGLQEQGFEDPNVFLVSSSELHLYDFHLLEETLEAELPAHKKDALLLALPNVRLEIINKKKKALRARIKYYAIASTLVAGVPVPGLSMVVDLSCLLKAITEYQVSFGLDTKSLQKLANSVRMPVEDLKAVTTSPLAATKITKDLILKILSMSLCKVALMALEEGSRFIPLFGIPVAMACSFASTYRALSFFLNMLADDAEKVFRKALGLTTAV